MSTKRWKTMFSDLLPVAADTYKGKATEYIVFNYTAIPEDFGDDDAQHWRYLVEVGLFTPHEKNSLAYRREITRRLVAGALRARRSRPPLTRTVSITFLNARFPGVLTMAKLSVNGLDELIDDLEEIARMPDSVALEMLTAEAEIISKEQKTAFSSAYSKDTQKGLPPAAFHIAKNSKKRQTGAQSMCIRRGRGMMEINGVLQRSHSSMSTVQQNAEFRSV